MSNNWIAVASAEHVRIGRVGGFMQVCHGKATPLRRVKPEDRIAYYSPTLKFGSNKKLQIFTAIGIVKSGEPYQFDMGDGFCPFRRDVSWLHANESPIRPILDVLEFSAGNRNWGYQLRFGIFQISDHDFKVIAAEMNAELRM
ncbi:TPA: EVE domain-containing protein [Yersinia enterocolitica]|nr:EVE domain-containing protein [Yersinia enterocolitica]